MSIISGVTVDFTVSPRIITIPFPLTTISIQDLHDTLRSIEDDPSNMAYPKLISSAGKENLGGGVNVGITSTLNNARLAFEARTTDTADGIATSQDTTGKILIDSSATYITDGVIRGAAIFNFNDDSLGNVISVDSENQLTHTTLTGGINNNWNIGDTYDVYNIIQCNVAGGNLVAIDSVGADIDPIFPTAFTQVVRTSSSSATIAQIAQIEFSSFDGQVTIDVVNGTPGTAFPCGTLQQPADNVVDALSIANERGLNQLRIIGDITFGNGHNIDNFIIIGQSQTLTTITVDSLASTLNSEFRTCSLQGTLDGNAYIANNHILDITYITGEINSCLLSGTIVLNGSDTLHVINCRDGLPGLGIPTIDMNGGGMDINIRNYRGGLQIQNNNGVDSDSVSIDMIGRLLLDSTLTNSNLTLLIRGIGPLIDNSSGPSINQDDLLNSTNISKYILDEQIAQHLLSGSLGEYVDQIKKDVSLVPGII